MAEEVIYVSVNSLRQTAKDLRAWLDTAPSNNIYRQRYEESWRWCVDQLQKYEIAEADRKARRTDTVIKLLGTGLITAGSVVISNSEFGARWISSMRGPTGTIFGRSL